MELCYLVSNLHDLTGYLMSLCYGVFCKGMLAMIYVNIRTADADTHDFHQHLILCDLRNGNLSEYDLAGFCHYFL